MTEGNLQSESDLDPIHPLQRVALEFNGAIFEAMIREEIKKNGSITLEIPSLGIKTTLGKDFLDDKAGIEA